METGAITSYIDVAQLVLYAFWIFFIGLIIYLRREDKREGYPLESDRTDRTKRVRIQGFPAQPGPKLFRLQGGRIAVAPNPDKDKRVIHAAPAALFPGAPLVPTGDPMRDGVGPAAYVERAEHPELTLEGLPMIVPMRVATDFSVAEGDTDPRGFSVVGADGHEGGVVRDLWVDRAEPRVLYFELEVSTPTGPRTVLLPTALTQINGWRRRVTVQSILGSQFQGAPTLANPDQITLNEEDRVTSYYAGGNLYAEPARQEPWL